MSLRSPFPQFHLPQTESVITSTSTESYDEPKKNTFLSANISQKVTSVIQTVLKFP
jgi:hypothetical protein